MTIMHFLHIRTNPYIKYQTLGLLKKNTGYKAFRYRVRVRVSTSVRGHIGAFSMLGITANGHSDTWAQ